MFRQVSRWLALIIRPIPRPIQSFEAFKAVQKSCYLEHKTKYQPGYSFSVKRRPIIVQLVAWVRIHEVSPYPRSVSNWHWICRVEHIENGYVQENQLTTDEFINEGIPTKWNA